MTLRYKFVLPMNAILLGVLLSSLAWEWRRQERDGLGLLEARLSEEARFVQAACRSFEPSPRFEEFLRAFCHASDAAASPEHQVAVLDESGRVVAQAAEHARRPMDPRRLAEAGDGSSVREQGGERFLVRVSTDRGRRVVVAESTRAVRSRVASNLRSQGLWFLGAAALLFGAVNVVMSRAVLRPVRRIGRAVRRLEQGGIGVEVPSPGGDELGALARRFNAMSRTLAEQSEADRLEMEVARRVQAGLLPPPVLRLGPVQVVGRCLPAGPVGGDLYDVQPLSDGRVGVLLVDLSGHNVPAALHTAMVRSIVWREAEQAPGPGEVLARLNERLCRDLPEEQFATVFFGWFEPLAGRFRYANAGHPPAFLARPGAPPEALGPTMPLSGIMPDASGAEASVSIGSGSRLLAYTDGVTETRGAGGELWGDGRLGTILQAGGPDDPSDVVERLLAEVAAFRGPGRQEDDVTVVLAVYDPAPEPERPCGPS